MSTCMKLVKLLIAKKGLEQSDDLAHIDTRIEAHVGVCARCTELWEKLRAPTVYSGTLQLKIANHREASSKRGAGVDLIAPAMGTRRYFMTSEEGIGTETKGKFFTIFVDEQEFHIEESTLTGGEIMDLAGIPREVGLIQILEDGTQLQVDEDEVIELKPGRRFKKAPHFIRG